MRHGFSRRQWLAGLLSSVGGFWLRRLWPAPPRAAAVSAPLPQPLAPLLAPADPLGHITTYVYDSAPPLLPLATQVTTFVYDPAARTFPPGPGPS
jgi:hypothetical protein